MTLQNFKQMDGVVRAKPLSVVSKARAQSGSGARKGGLSLQSSKAGMALPRSAKRWVGYLQLTIFIVAGVAVGIFLQVVPIGYLAIIGYAVVAFVKAIPSRITFMLALFSLLLVPVGVAIGQPAVANGFSFFSFLLLSVGVVTLGIELIKERRLSI